MFDQLLKMIKENSPDSFDKLLKKATVEVFKEKDSEFHGSLIHWAALFDRRTILDSIHRFIASRRERNELFTALDNRGRTPLHWCNYEGAPKSCKFFLEYFPKLVITTDTEGFTPLQLAAKKNLLSMVELLCNYDEQHCQADKNTWIVHAKVDNKTAINLATDATVRWRLRHSALRNHPLRSFIGLNLSTHRNYLADSMVDSSPLTQSELYYRSGKHPIVHALKEKAEIMYENEGLVMGDKAHVGAYGNLLQLKGKQLHPTKEKPRHHPSDAALYDSILTYKNKLCQQVVTGFNQRRPHSKITVGHWNDYPSVMVCINRSSIHKADKTEAPSPAAFEAWVDFLLSYTVGLINFAAYIQNLPIETERRGGFGFHMPTVAPTKESFRISMGIVPQAYVSLLIDVLIDLDKLLTKLESDDLYLAELPDDIFYASDSHLKYLGKKYKTPPLADLVELLWAQTEKGGQTTVQNIVRSSYARDGVSEVVFRYGYDNDAMNPAQAFNDALSWAAEKITVKKTSSRSSLTFETQYDLSYPTRFNNLPFICEDNDFWDLIRKIHTRVSSLDDPMTKACLASIKKAIQTKNIQYLYANLDSLNEAIFSYSLVSSSPETQEYGDAYGSDSDEEGEVNDVLLSAKKVVTHSGMRAIWASLIALQSCLGTHEKLKVYLQNAYYETPLGLKIITGLEKMTNYEIVKHTSEANVIIYDLNACITNGSNHEVNLKSLQQSKRYMILDATSATSVKVHQYLSLLTIGRVQALLVAESGFKNQQLAGDKNPHGIVRIFCKETKLRDALYKKVKEKERPLTSAESHRYRHLMKSIGATPSNKAILEGGTGPVSIRA
ncbi:MAG: ankyrin repeat domain-containing protein [Legionella sp.]|nr:ankyrin repeat domain-containing protein [Legionella sp.]